MPDTSALQARQDAADLLAAAARHPQINSASSLECLLAGAALGVPGHPIGTDAMRATSWDQLITAALRTLGALPEPDFDDPAVLLAQRHAQRALWPWP